MTIQRKFVLWSTTLICLVAVLGAVSVWTLVGVWRSARGATAEYAAMDRAEAAAAQVAWLRDALRTATGRTYTDAKFFAPLRLEVDEVLRQARLTAGASDGDSAAELAHAQDAADHFGRAEGHASGGGAAGGSGAARAPDPGAAAVELEATRQALLDLAKLVPGSVRRGVTATGDRLLGRLGWTCGVLVFVLAASATIHVSQYRFLVRPLITLRDDLRTSAAREYKNPVEARGGGREFGELAAHVNGLARDLAALSHGLEEKVIAKSRELVRSERLASVGFLAAGVAHEINNPLSVISGYAELAARSLRSVMLGGGGAAPADDEDDDELTAEDEAEALANAVEAQRIIRDEAFRCKEITARLLSLARGRDGGREALRVDEVARQVAALTKGLRNYRDRRVVLDFKGADELGVMANATELKQVMLNLTVNALEAVAPGRGEVRIGGRRAGEWVELSVADNGKGMSAETLGQVFEPFFTKKRGAGEPGTGLGLSITHAIVENHGGRISAESAGPGRGSRFVVRLPATARALVAVSPAAG